MGWDIFFWCLKIYGMGALLSAFIMQYTIQKVCGKEFGEMKYGFVIFFASLLMWWVMLIVNPMKMNWMFNTSYVQSLQVQASMIGPKIKELFIKIKKEAEAEIAAEEAEKEEV